MVLDPIIDGFHLTRVLMDGGSSLNLLYQDTVLKALEESSRPMETPNALSERRSIRRLSQRKYKAASQGNSPVRLLNVRTSSSAPGVTYNKTAWHVLSKHRNAAPTPALANLRN